MMAEAQGNTATSLGFINQVRARVGLAAYTAADITTIAQFETALANEIIFELAF
jgi:hypothetical protein